MAYRFFAHACLAVVLLCTSLARAQDAPSERWLPLFDGRTLDGWKVVGSDKTRWEVVDGVIVGSGEPSMLVSVTGPYRNFRYRVEMKINDGGNSGLYFRTAPEPGFLDGYEAQVDSTHTDPIRTGSLYGMCHVYTKLVEPDTWFTYQIDVRDDVWRGREMTRIKVTVDGKELYEHLDFAKQFGPGHFAFQQHDPKSLVSIRRIEVLTLPDREQKPQPQTQPGRAEESSAAEPASAKVIDTLAIGDNVKIHFDVTETPDLRKWVQSDLMPACRDWYPRICEQLRADGFEPPAEFSVTFRDKMDGVAHTSGTDITCAGPWYRNNLKTEAVGSVVHELVHVVQQYGSFRRANRPPGWLVEGIADHIRWYQFEPVDKRRRIDWTRANYDQAYFPSATFLDYIVRTIDAQAITKINDDCRAGRYSETYWVDKYGRTAEQLWADAKAEATQ
ncbi:MAG: DUF1080 domain-containing protein [Leptolyngbya sp. PLA3]|nr:MAG: DUF1080 domain-containing protein [Cyanobacteria bacterium CYA]MCE7969023.1 DUF1080 domain-containing protein [Leptolyngbya sp. PL-A3]